MGQHAEVALARAAVVRAPGDRTAEPSLVPAEGALGLPPLAEHPPVPVTLAPGAQVQGHLDPVPTPRRPVVAARVDRDDRRADAPLVPRLPVVALGVERGVGRRPGPPDPERRQEQDRGELRGAVGRAEGDGRPGDEVEVGVDRGGQLGPRAGRVLALGPGDEVPGRVPGVPPGGIDGDGRLVGDQAAIDGGRDGAEEEVEEPPPFSSRSRAYLRVE